MKNKHPQPEVPTEYDLLPRRRWYLPFKSACDRILAVVLLVLCSPVIFAAGVLVKLTSPGSMFYAQTRMGLLGQTYRIYKIRTMYADAEAQTGAVWSCDNDPRITPVGYFLRLTHIDELPQLWNVVRGEMSLVGPRPERPEFVNELEWQVPGYRARLAIRPGISGLAQVRLPPDSDVASVRKKLTRDLYYVRELGPRLDGIILAATGLRVATGFWEALRRYFWLPGQNEIKRVAQQILPEDPDIEVVPAAERVPVMEPHQPHKLRVRRKAQLEDAVSPEDSAEFAV